MQKKWYKNPDEYHNVTNFLLQSCNQYTGNTCSDKLGFYFPMFKRYMLVFPRSIYFTLHVWIYVCECKHHHHSYFNSRKKTSCILTIFLFLFFTTCSKTSQLLITLIYISVIFLQIQLNMLSPANTENCIPFKIQFFFLYLAN